MKSSRSHAVSIPSAALFEQARVLPENHNLLLAEPVVVAGWGGQIDVPTMVEIPIKRTHPVGYYEIHLDQRSKSGCNGGSGATTLVTISGAF